MQSDLDSHKHHIIGLFGTERDSNDLALTINSKYTPFVLCEDVYCCRNFHLEVNFFFENTIEIRSMYVTMKYKTRKLFHKLIAEETVKVKFGFISSSSSQFYGAKRTVYYYLLVNFKRLQIKTILLGKQRLVGGTVWQLSGFFEEGIKLFSAVLHIYSFHSLCILILQLF